MADVKISALPASTTPLAGTEVLPIVQSSTTKQVSVANLTAGRAVSALTLTTTGTGANTFAGNTIISVTDNTNAALRITQMGTGNALLVEDSTNPDASPFMINSSGQVVVGDTSLYTSAGVTGGLQVTGASADSATIAINSFRNSTNGPFLTLAHSKSGVNGTQTALVANDAVGLIRFSGSDGTAFIQAAAIDGFVDGTPGTNDMPGRLVFSTTADGSSSPTERMRIDSAGNVGIGPGVAIANSILTLQKSITGSSTSAGIYNSSTIQSDVTSAANINWTNVSTVASAFTLSILRHYLAAQNTIGASSVVTNQYGFQAESNLTGATSNYGFVSSIAAGTNRFNFYAGGTADNYFAGSVGVGAAPTSAAKANITSTSAGASTIALSLQNASTTVGSETVLDLVANNSGAGVRSAQITAINTNGSTGVNMLFKIGNGAVASEAMRLDSIGNFIVSTGAVVVYQPAPAAISAAATLTNADIQAQIISATGTTYTITMPLGTTLETLITWPAVNLGYNFTVINTATGIITMAVNTGVTSLGLLTIAAATSAQFRIRRTAANTFILYRLA